jgi:hypothetical protein
MFVIPFDRTQERRSFEIIQQFFQTLHMHSYNDEYISEPVSELIAFNQLMSLCSPLLESITEPTD